ncbi:MAG: M20 family metallopeptidase [Dehalococcoidia bacterium]
MTAGIEIGERISAAIERERGRVARIAETIRTNPETGFQERQAADLLTEALRGYGFAVERPVGGLETAFRATIRGKAGGPTIAILAEYDALPGIGHGCAHNLIAGAALASAAALNALMPEIDGSLVVIGTPAEEGGGGKILLLDNGVFDGVAAALMVHHAGDRSGAPTQPPEGTCLAVAHLRYEFFGRPAHAAGDPHNGINALNAVIKLFTGIDAMRQHIKSDARIHGIITSGGDAPNVVPRYAAARFYIRAADRAYLEELTKKVESIAEGAALMTGAEAKISSESPIYYDERPSYVIGQVYQEHMREVGIAINPRPPGRGSYSTDFGNISYVIPSVSGSFAISHEPIPGHSPQVAECAGSEFGVRQMFRMAEAMARTAVDLFRDPELLRRARAQQQNWPG